jgi:hypothetical protein
MEEQHAMSAANRFVTVTVLWAAGLAVLIVVAGAIGDEPLTASRFLRWAPSVLGLAMYPAGVAVASVLIGESQPWRVLLHVVAAAVAVSVIILAVSIVAANSDSTRGVAALLATTRDPGESWETRNHAAWTLVTALLAGPRALLLAAIGVQVGVWAEYGIPRSLHRPLYWVVGIGLMVSGIAIWDTTYEVVVLHTSADASVAALYTLVLPLSVCAGLGLPTLTVLSNPARFRP